MRRSQRCANSCGALRTCALRGARADTCTGRGKTAAAGFCDADGRAVSCWHEKVLAVRDCPRGGEQCAVREGEALCTLGPCPPDIKEGAPPTCSASGTRILRCEKGRVASLDCGAFGLRCFNGVGENGAAACAPVSGNCPLAATGLRRCEGRVAVGCANGHEVRVDCAAAGLACTTATGAVAVGICAVPPPAAGADAGTCDPSQPPRCDGANIAYCAAGKPRSYFCKSLGFARCVSDGKFARCSG